MSSEQENATGYGPRHRTGGRWDRLVFNGDENNYELWEVKFLAYLRTLGLKDTILSTVDPDEEKNAECYAELIQVLDDKSLSLVMRDAADDGKKALQILRGHYASQGKPRIIALYTELTSLFKEPGETMTDYVLRAEKAVTSLRNAKEVISDGLIIAMILKGLPESYKPFAIHTTQSSEDLTFTQFKSRLRSYEETEKFESKPKSDNVMKVDMTTVNCYNCGQRGHMARDCRQKTAPKWCSYHRSTTHSDETCRRRSKRKDDAKQTSDMQDIHVEDQTMVFKVSRNLLPDNIKLNGIMVDCGATSHIITDEEMFTRIDKTFNPSRHYMELADGKKMNNVALKRGDAQIELLNSKGSNQAAGSDVESENETYERPPSSYGSMKSECDEMEKRSDEEVEGGGGISEVVCFAAPDPPAPPVVGSQMGHSRYTETLYTEATEQTRPPDGMVIDAGSEELDEIEDAELDDDDELLTTCSPEPPEPLEMEGLPQEDESSQPGKLDPELDLPYIFKSIREVLSRLNNDELFKFKIWFKKWEPLPVLQQILDGDVLDFVDKIIELFGQDKALTQTISTLERLEKTEEINELKTRCAKAMFRFYLKEFLFRKSQITHEGVPQAGKQQFLEDVYVEPQISIRGFGGVDPSHEILTQTPKPIQVPSEDSFVALNNLFRLQKDDGSPVKTVVTTGIPGIGMSVSVAKFCLDWSEEKANRDIQYILKLSFRSLRHFRNKEYEEEGISMQDILEYCHAPIKGLKILEEENAKYVIIMDCYDCYEAPLDFQKAPEITDNNTKTHIDTLIVNLIRRNLLPNARLWILGRRAAITEIPSKFVDVVAELQGFTDEMKDDYLIKHFTDAQLSAKIVRHYKRVPIIQILARQPFFTWMVSRIFKSCFKQGNYGSNKPRVTPFLIHFIIIQTNRMLKFYFRKRDNEKWSDVEVNLLRMLGKMSFKMLEKNTNVFTEEDVKDVALDLNEVVVFSGLCTELVPTAITGKRTFCFSHYTIQEFMAALYVFLAFYLESKNVLESGFLPRVFSYKYNGKSAAGLVQCAVARTLGSKLGHYDMFLRYLCGLLSVHCHCNLLAGFLYSHGIPKVEGLVEAEQLLDQTIQTAPEDRKRNLYECIREMTQEDD